MDLTGGRIETRRHTVRHKVDWMTSDRHYPGEPVFPDLATIGRIETEVERNGNIEYETRCYLCSLALCALTFARAVRAHWGVENRLHWVLDVIFREFERYQHSEKALVSALAEMYVQGVRTRKVKE